MLSRFGPWLSCGLAMLLLAGAGRAVAQNAAPPAAQEPPARVRLPDPPVADDAPPRAFLAASRQAIAAGRLGEATEALERAETRLLARSVRPSRAGTPSDQSLVGLLAQARQALAEDDRLRALAAIDAALADPGLDAAPE